MRDWASDWEIEARLKRARVCQHRARRWVWYTKFAIVSSLFMAGIGWLAGVWWITAFYLLATSVWLFFLRSWRRSLVFWKVVEGELLEDQKRLGVHNGDYLPGRTVRPT